MKNKKGFTLIELLAVIVILAIIMVIAVPQILNVIDSSRTSAWNDSVKLIKNAIETNTTLFNPNTGLPEHTLNTLCKSDATSEFSKIADVGDMTISCDTSTKTFTLTGIKQFAGKTATITCTSVSDGTNANCSSDVGSGEQGGGSGGGSEPSNPYETSFSGNYSAYKWKDVTTSGYSNAGSFFGSSSWYTTLNPSSKAYLRSDGTKPEVCGVFSGGTVCMTSPYYNSDYDSANRYNADFADCKSIDAQYDGTGSTCIKGYTKAKIDEMISKGATFCMVGRTNAYCNGDNNGMNCNIDKVGKVYCAGNNSSSYLDIYNDGYTD